MSHEFESHSPKMPEHDPQDDHPGQRDHADHLTDVNLRRAAGVLSFGSDADGASLRAAAGTVDRTRVHASGTPRVARRRRGWMAFGSAIAACVAAAAVLVTGQRGTEVQASTILSSLRNMTFGGLDIKFEGVGDDLATIDGLLRLRLKSPISIEDLGSPATASKSEFGAMHAALRLRTDVRAPLSGAEVRLEGALSPSVGWVYAQTDAATAQRVMAYQPRSMIVMKMLQNGLLVNIGPTTANLLGPFLGGKPAVNAQENTLLLHALAFIQRHDPQAAAQIQHELTRTPTDQERRLDELAIGLLTGRAGPADLELMVKLLSEVDAKPSVQRLDGNRFLLVTELKAPLQDHPDARLRVMYEPSAGVRWIEIEPIAAPDGHLESNVAAKGRIRIEPNLTPIEPSDMDSARLITVGRTNFIDAAAMLRILPRPQLESVPTAKPAI